MQLQRNAVTKGWKKKKRKNKAKIVIWAPHTFRWGMNSIASLIGYSIHREYFVQKFNFVWVIWGLHRGWECQRRWNIFYTKMKLIFDMEPNISCLSMPLLHSIEWELDICLRTKKEKKKRRKHRCIVHASAGSLALITAFDQIVPLDSLHPLCMHKTHVKQI